VIPAGINQSAKSAGSIKAELFGNLIIGQAVKKPAFFIGGRYE